MKKLSPRRTAVVFILAMGLLGVGSSAAASANDNEAVVPASCSYQLVTTNITYGGVREQLRPISKVARVAPGGAFTVSGTQVKRIKISSTISSALKSRFGEENYSTVLYSFLGLLGQRLATDPLRYTPETKPARSYTWTSPGGQVGARWVVLAVPSVQIRDLQVFVSRLGTGPGCGGTNFLPVAIPGRVVVPSEKTEWVSSKTKIRVRKGAIVRATIS